MPSMINISDMPKPQTSIRQNQVLMEYMQTRGDARKTDMDAALAVATSKESLLESSLRGAMIDRTG